VDLDGRKIDFRLVPEGQDERLMARGQRAKAPPRRSPASATEELTAVKEVDRAVKKATRKRLGKAGKEGAAPSATPRSGRGATKSAVRSTKRR